MQTVQTSEGMYDKCSVMETGISANYAKKFNINL
jgi:hypothetical protein